MKIKIPVIVGISSLVLGILVLLGEQRLSPEGSHALVYAGIAAIEHCALQIAAGATLLGYASISTESDDKILKKYKQIIGKEGVIIFTIICIAGSAEDFSNIAKDYSQGSKQGVLRAAYPYEENKIRGMVNQKTMEFTVSEATYEKVLLDVGKEYQEYPITYYEFTSSLVELK